MVIGCGALETMPRGGDGRMLSSDWLPGGGETRPLGK